MTKKSNLAIERRKLCVQNKSDFDCDRTSLLFEDESVLQNIFGALARCKRDERMLSCRNAMVKVTGSVALWKSRAELVFFYTIHSIDGVKLLNINS
jgi:hypothetical protein